MCKSDCESNKGENQKYKKAIMRIETRPMDIYIDERENTGMSQFKLLLQSQEPPLPPPGISRGASLILSRPSPPRQPPPELSPVRSFESPNHPTSAPDVRRRDPSEPLQTNQPPTPRLSPRRETAMATLSGAERIRAITDEDGMFKAFDSYPWHKDKMFSVPSHPPPPPGLPTHLAQRFRPTSFNLDYHQHEEEEKV